ncbi:MAG: hypothetical protein ACRDAM_15720 [Casimicrobium sp.]
MWSPDPFELAFVEAGMWQPVTATIAFGGTRVVPGHMRVRAIDRLFGEDFKVQATDYDGRFATARFEGLNVDDTIDHGGIEYKVLTPPMLLRRGTHSECRLKRLNRVYPKQAINTGGANVMHDMSANSYISRIAAQPLNAFAIVRSVNDTLIDYASADNASHASSVLGFLTGALGAGEKGFVQNKGELENFAWNWVPNQPIWLGVGNGLVTQGNILAPAVFVQRVAFAISPTKIFIEIEESVNF